MKSHENNSRICEKGCEILLKLTKEGFLKTISQRRPDRHILKKHIEDNQIIAGEEKCIEFLVSLLERHINNPSICENGCKALRNITADGNLSITFMLSIAKSFLQTKMASEREKTMQSKHW